MDFLKKNRLYQFTPTTTEAEKNAPEQNLQSFNEQSAFKPEQKYLNQEQAMSFSSMVQLYSAQIEQKKYTFKDGKSSKKASREIRPNSSMSKVIASLQSLNSLLDSSMEQVDLKDEQAILAAQKPFLDVCAACRTYLKNHRKKPWTAEGKARRQMVEDLLKQAEKESVAIYQRLKSYNEGNNPDFPKLDKWKDVVEDIRTEEVKGKEIDLGGSGTSKLHIVEVTNKSGETETKFFKESEDMPAKYYGDNIQKELDRLSLEEKDENTSEEKRAESKKLKELLDLVYKTMKSTSAVDLDQTFYKANTPAQFLEFIRLDMNSSTLKVFEKIDQNSALYKKLESIVWGIRQDTYLANTAQSMARIGKDSSITKRNAATSRLADILGVGNLVVKSSMTKMEINGEKVYGLLMDKAEGQDMRTTDEYVKITQGTIEYTESAYRQLINLQIFDTLCAQVDRNIGNYMVEGEGKKNKKIEKITAIDNDLSFGNLKFKDIAPAGINSYFNMTKITDKNGDLGVPAVDAEFADKILAVTEEQIRYQMVDLLDNVELDALIDRIKGVQDLLRNAREKKPEIFIPSNDETAWKKAMKDFSNKLNKMTDKAAVYEVFNTTYFSPLAFSKTRKPYIELS